MNDNRYKFFFAGNKVICVSSYSGRKVRGVAICSEDDEYDREIGMKLARARCDAKITEKRYYRAAWCYDNALVAVNAAHKQEVKMAEYYTDAWTKYNDAVVALNKLQASL